MPTSARASACERPGQRHRAGQPATAEQGDRLDDDADGELQPGQPDHDQEHHDQRVERQRLGEVVAGGQPGRERRRALPQHTGRPGMPTSSTASASTAPITANGEDFFGAAPRPER